MELLLAGSCRSGPPGGELRPWGEALAMGATPAAGATALRPGLPSSKGAIGPTSQGPDILARDARESGGPALRECGPAPSIRGTFRALAAFMEPRDHETRRIGQSLPIKRHLGSFAAIIGLFVELSLDLG